jgi:hypothetical protein
MLLAAYDKAGLSSKSPAKATPPEADAASPAPAAALRPCDAAVCERHTSNTNTGVTVTEHGLRSGHSAHIAP